MGAGRNMGLKILDQESVPPVAKPRRFGKIEMMNLIRRCEECLREAYRPDGLNIGMNLGKAGGAGIEDHMHVHIVPRWTGDTNFMSVIGDVRVIPEGLLETYDLLAEELKAGA